MNWRSIYNMRKLSIPLLTLLLLLIAIIIGSDEYDYTLIYSLYLLVGIASFGLGYMEFANVVKLGFGVTRKHIYIHFCINMIKMLLILLGFTFMYNLLFAFVKSSYFLDLFNFKMLLFLSLIIPFFGELGMLFANIHIDRKIGSLIFIGIAIIIILEIFVFERKLFINFILGITIAVIALVNYIIIYNIKIERS